MSKPSPNHDAERASLLAELVEVTGREDMAELLAGESIETIRDHLASRRQALADIERYARLGAIWKDDRAVLLKERHARHSDGGDDTVVAFGPSLEIPFNRG